ncbi:CAP domain-containing protein [Micromonospora cathayae]|uniref:CAP domain-containing protein n=1 Tax=Micromonospora cathayae TaxID=3028804 RepID=A0ABY7ZWX6_9ACTN|nr:CAP domain-containing protein [Micromonospora sp. HUAS 3]WDZ87420.1 CAP domain-containing protein [Micromonospora sp. HUAS 3]
MYGWTDPSAPEPDPRRTEPPTEEPPYWDNGRPMPRSAYLFGDEPERSDDPAHPATPDDRRYRQPAADEWHTGERRYPLPADTHPAGPFPGGSGSSPFPGGPGSGPFPGAAGPLAGRSAGPRSGDATPGDGRHRSRRRLPRPLLIAGAAATATLVVAVGVGAVLLPDDERTGTTATAEEVPVAPPLPGADLPPSGSASPSPSPTTASPSPSPSRSVKPTPAPSRTTAPSRRTAERSKAPTPRATTAAPLATGGTEQAQVVALVNAERAKAGCGALSVDAKLTTAAQRHSEDQAAHKKMSHTGSDGSDAGDRLDRVGYDWRGYGENVAWNQQTPAAVMAAWMNSAGHRANILNCAFTEIGVGVARSNGPYWTQVFGTPA